MRAEALHTLHLLLIIAGCITLAMLLYAAAMWETPKQKRARDEWHANYRDERDRYGR